MLLKRIFPAVGLYRPTNSFTNVDLPEPDGPTKAIVSPLLTEKDKSSIELVKAVLCVKVTSSKHNVCNGPSVTAFLGFRSMGFCISSSKLCSEEAVSRYSKIILPNSCNGAKIDVEINCVVINSPVLKKFPKMSHNNIKRIDCFRIFIVLPWINERVRTWRTLDISRSNMPFVLSFKRLISGKVKPRLFTSSIFRNDSVINPACTLVSLLMDLCIVLIFLLTIPVKPPRNNTPTKNTGISSQFLVTEYQSKKQMPTTVVNNTPTSDCMKRCRSVFTFCSMDNVSPLCCFSNSWNDNRRVCFNPSSNTCRPSLC